MCFNSFKALDKCQLGDDVRRKEGRQARFYRSDFLSYNRQVLSLFLLNVIHKFLKSNKFNY